VEVTAETRQATIRLLPSATLKQKLTLKDKAAFFPNGGYNLMFDTGGRAYLFWGGGDAAAENEFKVPAGAYNYFMFSPEVSTRNNGRLRVEPGATVELPAIQLELTPLAQKYGQAPPTLNVTDARGLAKPFRLEDYRGKWLVLEFWGYW
jgi:hypothetical protein